MGTDKSEEIDLGQFFNLVGKAIEKLVLFLSKIFQSIFSLIIIALKAVINNFKVIAISMIIAAIIGFALDKSSKDVYSSKMMVKPYFDSKYQLVTNINYYNALLADKDYSRLSEIFQLEEEDVKALIHFEITPGPETENDRILEYESFISQVDSTRAKEITFEKFIEERSIYSGSLFEIDVKSLKKDIFRSLEEGLNTTFTNTYSTKKMKKRDSLISIEKSRILNSLNQVDSLQKVYIDVLKEDSKSSKGTINLSDGMSMVQERVKTREYELLNKELELRQSLTDLEAKKVEEDVFFDTISSFQDVGYKESRLIDKKTLILPILTLFLLVVGYCVKKTVVFINKYEV